jgi:hypothetical protein
VNGQILEGDLLLSVDDVNVTQLPGKTLSEHLIGDPGESFSLSKTVRQDTYTREHVFF